MNRHSATPGGGERSVRWWDGLAARLAARWPHVALAALAAGLALAPSLRGAPWLAAATGIGAIALLAAVSSRVALIAALALSAGVTGGWLRIDAIDRTAERALRLERFEGPAAVLQRPRRTRFGSWAIVELREGPARGSRVVARADRGVRWPGEGEPGVVVRASGSIERPVRTPGSRLDWPAHLRRRGVAAELRLDSLRPTSGSRGGFAGWVDGIRRGAERGVAAGAAPARAAVARGMVLGQDETIDPHVVGDFRRSGLAHLLAVSGQNVVLLCALAVPLLAATGAGLRARVAGLAALVGLYVLVAGAGPSLQRAAAMAVAGLAALAVGRASSRWYALLLAAAITLAVEPRAAAEPGWQLSFAAVAGILLLARRLRRPLSGLPRPLAEGAAMTLAATLATAPVAGYHFGVVSLAGLAANLVALPLVAPIVWLGMVQAVLGIASGVAPDASAAASVLGHVTALLIGGLLRIAADFAALPAAQVRLPLDTPAHVVAAYVLSAAAWLGLRWRGRAVAPRVVEGAAAWRRAAPRGRLAIAALAAVVLAAGWQRTTAPPPPEDLTVSFLDVGQGDATLIQDGRGAAVLFDGGPPEARTARLLKRAGVRRLALVVATHASRDHHGGLAEVLRRVPTAALLDGGDGTRDPDFAAVLAEARRRGTRRLTPHAGQTLRAGRLEIRILGPPPRPPGPPPEDPNPRALTAVVSAGGFDLFLSGDAESPALLGYDLPRVEVMKVPHHGSADPGLPALLDRLRPRVAAIEVGADNPYGHPAPSTLAALDRSVPHVRRTDRDGTVRLAVAGERIELR